MAVLVKMPVSGMDEATYDQISAHLAPLMKGQTGFINHVAYATPVGLCVEEIWDSQAQFEAWFSRNVKPNVPAGNPARGDRAPLGPAGLITEPLRRPAR